MISVGKERPSGVVVHSGAGLSRDTLPKNLYVYISKYVCA